jgi:hypothetical protein
MMSRLLMRRRAQQLGAAALLAALCADPARAAVTLQASSTTVSSPGQSGTICVALITGGEEVAGTQNDLVWDGACASLPDTGSCYAAGSHGKSLQGKLLENRDFTYRALILSLSDVDPMDSGVLYCCNFVAEAEPGQCCNIAMTGMGASDSKGTAVAALGSSGKLCVASSGNSGRAGGGGFDNGQPLSASNEAPGGQAAPAPAAPANAAPGGAPAAPPAQVLQGGGARAGEPTGNVPPTLAAPPTVAAQGPTPAVAVTAAVPAAAAAPATHAPAVAPATAAATSPAATAAASAAVTSPAADTPTAATRGSTPTHRRMVPPTLAGGGGAAAEEKKSGWFGCQIGGTSVPWPATLIAALFVLAGRRARRSSAQRRSDH